jgi:hypothetical protein
MNHIEQEILLHTQPAYGAAVPLALSSKLLQRLEATAKPCVRMALEGTSASVGATPAWLDRCVDIRTLGFSNRQGATVLHVTAPLLGEAAPRLFEQASFFENIASPDETALEILSKIAREVRSENPASDLYDSSLLKKFAQWKPLLGSDLQRVDLPGSVDSSLDLSVAISAQTLNDRTPQPRQVRIVGKLDMVRHSTRSFELLLPDGDSVRGVLVDGTPEILQKHFGNEITILGKAIYRASGSLLRLDASEILATNEGRDVFSTVPLPFTLPRRLDSRSQTSRSGVAAFFGIWPGEETDAELMAAVAGLRSS